MENFLLQHGLPALFLLSFLAATVIPLGSEWLLIALLLQGQPASSLVLAATVGNSLGAATTYALGFWGSDLLIHRLLRLDQDQIARAMGVYDRYGLWSLLFSWLPVIGDPLCLAAGLMRLTLPRFLLLVITGKLGRYALVAFLTLRGANA